MELSHRSVRIHLFTRQIFSMVPHPCCQPYFLSFNSDFLWVNCLETWPSVFTWDTACPCEVVEVTGEDVMVLNTDFQPYFPFSTPTVPPILICIVKNCESLG